MAGHVDAGAGGVKHQPVIAALDILIDDLTQGERQGPLAEPVFQGNCRAFLRAVEDDGFIQQCARLVNLAVKGGDILGIAQKHRFIHRLVPRLLAGSGNL